MSGYGLIVFLSMLVESKTFAVLLQNERPKCRNDESCTIEVNKTTHECHIGRKAECDTLKWPAVDGHAIPLKKVWLYPYLATVSIEEKSYIHEYREAKLKALNFAFQLPRISFGQGGVGQFVMAVFQNTVSGSDFIYQEPVCRLFDFREARLLSEEVIALKNPTVPSDCLGLDLIAGVYSLRLTTISTTFSLQYNITWLEDEDDVEESDAWVQKLMAVAVVPEERLVHVVFQPLKDFIPMAVVSLVSLQGTVRSEAVLRGHTSVMFTEVDSGQYKVTISPKGEECNVLQCANMSSKSFLLDFTVTPKGDDYTFMAIILVVLTPLFLVPMLLCLRKYKSNKEGQLVLLVNSLISRDLEERIVEKFRSLLTEVLGADVVIMNCWLSSAVNNSSLVDADTSLLNHQVDTISPGDSGQRRFDYKINVLFPSTEHRLQDSWSQPLGRQESHKKAGCFSACVSRSVPGDILTVIFSDQPQANSTIFDDDVGSTGGATVLEYPGRNSLTCATSPSLNNAPDLVKPILPDTVNLFYLPDQVDTFLASLQQRQSLKRSDIVESDCWKSICSMLLIIAQHQPYPNNRHPYTRASYLNTCTEGSNSISNITEAAAFLSADLSDSSPSNTNHFQVSEHPWSMKKGAYKHHPLSLETCSEVSSSYSNITEAAAFLSADPSNSLPNRTMSPVPVQVSGLRPCIISPAPSPVSTATSSINPRDVPRGAFSVITPTHLSNVSMDVWFKNLNNNFESVPPDSGRGDSFGHSYNMEPTYPPAFRTAIIPPKQ